MADRTIPVDPFNPGQVFACLGLMEAAEALIGPAEGGFTWKTGATTVDFTLSTQGDADPVAEVLDFLAAAEVVELAPNGWEPPKKDGKAEKKRDAKDGESAVRREDCPTFPGAVPEKMALPILLRRGNHPPVMLCHWAEDEKAGLPPFKLYSGNRTGASIARAMTAGTWTKGKTPKIVTRGIAQLHEADRDGLCRDPFNVLCPMKGSFNFDTRGAWTALDAGYSPNDQGDAVLASPVVEMLAAWGVEAFRPAAVDQGHHVYRLTLWTGSLPTPLARAALGGALGDLIDTRTYRFSLAMAGKNKVVTAATEDL
ncbi:type I-G CRISPR-associated protein Cas8g2 [Rhodospira trueperi]|uniref:CRISPR-associated protein Csx14 n=1 Tax=Rhodospira trueperi TaxID=69960 RepID=A0A1G7EFZ5_9PROT|nr:type I-U CRISPR-associated protein Cas8c [Rhodospira trueperi]SDE62562.1 CRISPR-associated protein Csx14 [Rhodospira trueperi]